MGERLGKKKQKQLPVSKSTWRWKQQYESLRQSLREEKIFIRGLNIDQHEVWWKRMTSSTNHTLPYIHVTQDTGDIP